MSEVLSIRIKKELKKAMREVNIDWRKEIEKFIEEKIRQFKKEEFLRKAKYHRGKLPLLEFSQAEWIREDRDER